MRFQKLMISTVISLWMDADRTIGRWGAFEVNINSLVTYRESCCHISLMLIDFLQLCSNIMELDCNGAQLQTKVLPSFRVCSVWDLQPPPLLSNYTWPYLESFHCYNELWFENVTINHNLRISFYFLSRWDEWCRQGIHISLKFSLSHDFIIHISLKFSPSHGLIKRILPWSRKSTLWSWVHYTMDCLCSDSLHWCK